VTVQSEPGRRTRRRKQEPKTPQRQLRLPALGVYGFESYEPLILASLVTEDPLLLIGASGTGKTFLLNSLSEALGLEHRHYNASLISFDDLVGFPYPDSGGHEVKFLQTPATVWTAESVLVDEISRCKPEHQNRLFALVQERRVQGIRLERLRFRWAAMNPCSTDQGPDDGYAGSEPLDPALADRFGLIVPAADWLALSDGDRRSIADPAGEGVPADDGGWLRQRLPEWRALFQQRLARCAPEVLDYATAATTTLNQHEIRISPRRARFLTRSLLAAEIVAGARSASLFENVLTCTLPQQAWGVHVDATKIRAAHRAAWDFAMSDPRRQWIQQFHLTRPLAKKLELLLESCPDPDTGTQAVSELLGNEPKERAAAFAYAVYPAALNGALSVGLEGVNDLGKVAVPVMDVNGKITWQESTSQRATTHPDLARYATVVNQLEGARKRRAEQFFAWCTVARVVLGDPAEIEKEIEACVRRLRGVVKEKAS
jgi:MoxR-like ATPase